MGRVSRIGGLFATFLIAGCAPVLVVHQPIDATLYPEPARDTITFWGHASVYMDVGGMGIVTDPVFEERYSIFHGRTVPRPPPEAYDQTSIILISHAHHDHLQPKTLKRFSSNAIILCPEPSAKHVRDLGPAVLVMKPGDEYPFPGGRIIAVPAHHPGSRWIGKAAADGRALGYVIETEQGTVYVSGDTDYFEGLEEIGARYRPDLAILNVNAHLPPEDAMRAMHTVGAHRAVPVHMGAYGNRAGRRGQKWRKEFLELANERGIPLAVGQSVSLRTLERLGRLEGAPSWFSSPAPGGVQ